ncbi:MAG: hypothetical protein GY797_24150 [Deltaproteobacteria bacterium]|nr:hypothetical protein [Deltaproteobacteria bacterium]
MNQKGVTLIVFIIMVAIIGILAAISVASYMMIIRDAKETLAQPSYKGKVLFVQQIGSEILIQNMSDSPVAIRISWDGKDPDGIGDGEDSYIDNYVEPYEGITLPFNEHTTVQVWAWDSTTALVDSCNLNFSIPSSAKIPHPSSAKITQELCQKQTISPGGEYYICQILDYQQIAVFRKDSELKIQHWNISYRDIKYIKEFLWINEKTFAVIFDLPEPQKPEIRIFRMNLINEIHKFMGYRFIKLDKNVPDKLLLSKDGETYTPQLSITTGIEPYTQCIHYIEQERYKQDDIEQERYKQAIQACEEASKEDNTDRKIQAIINLGIVYYKSDGYTKAIEELNKVIEILALLENKKNLARAPKKLKLLIPLYSYPTWYNKPAYIWDDIAEANTLVPITAIINPGNGPGQGIPNADYQKGLEKLRETGVTILGYIHTSYGDRKIEYVKADVDIYNQYFNINGIFFDEVANNADKLDYYEELYQYVKNLSHLDKVFLNPGTSIDESYFNRLPDATIVISENASDTFLEKLQEDMRSYPVERSAMLVHTVPDVEKMKAHTDVAVNNNIGYVYVTNDIMPNPWDTLPDFWQEEIEYIASKNSESVADNPDASQAIERYKGSVLRIVQTETEVIAKNISDAPVEIRIAWDTGHDTYLDNWVEPGESVAQNINNHKSVMVLAWGSSGLLVDEFRFPLQEGEIENRNIEKSKSGYEEGEVLYNGKVLLITQTTSKITVQNISDAPVAIRISWDEKDPGGIGKEGSDSYLDNWVGPGESVKREIKQHISVQVWSWGSSGALVDSFSSPLTTKDEPSFRDVRYEGDVLLVIQTDSAIVVENIADVPIAIRISWDGGDPFGTGRGEDSFIDNWIPPGERVTRPFNEHTSTQIWSWDSSTALVDSCDLTLSHQ